MNNIDKELTKLYIMLGQLQENIVQLKRELKYSKSSMADILGTINAMTQLSKNNDSEESQMDISNDEN